MKVGFFMTKNKINRKIYWNIALLGPKAISQVVIAMSMKVSAIVMK